MINLTYSWMSPAFYHAADMYTIQKDQWLYDLWVHVEDSLSSVIRNNSDLWFIRHIENVNNI